MKKGATIIAVSATLITCSIVSANNDINKNAKSSDAVQIPVYESSSVEQVSFNEGLENYEVPVIKKSSEVLTDEEIKNYEALIEDNESEPVANEDLVELEALKDEFEDQEQVAAKTEKEIIEKQEELKGLNEEIGEKELDLGVYDYESDIEMLSNTINAGVEEMEIRLSEDKSLLEGERDFLSNRIKKFKELNLKYLEKLESKECTSIKELAQEFDAEFDKLCAE
jgi:hypothetical protein